jgi:transposase-like protein
MQNGAILDYWEQLVKIAEETGWSLRDACIDAGISDSTFYRWKNQTWSPRKQAAEKVAEYMLTYRR